VELTALSSRIGRANTLLKLLCFTRYSNEVFKRW